MWFFEDFIFIPFFSLFSSLPKSKMKINKIIFLNIYLYYKWHVYVCITLDDIGEWQQQINLPFYSYLFNFFLLLSIVYFHFLHRRIWNKSVSFSFIDGFTARVNSCTFVPPINNEERIWNKPCVTLCLVSKFVEPPPWKCCLSATSWLVNRRSSVTSSRTFFSKYIF